MKDSLWDLSPLLHIVKDTLISKSDTYRGLMGIDNPRKPLTKKQKAKKKAKRKIFKKRYK
jgi:hypothetical protein